MILKHILREDVCILLDEYKRRPPEEMESPLWLEVVEQVYACSSLMERFFLANARDKAKRSVQRVKAHERLMMRLLGQDKYFHTEPSYTISAGTDHVLKINPTPLPTLDRVIEKVLSERKQ